MIGEYVGKISLEPVRRPRLRIAKVLDPDVTNQAVQDRTVALSAVPG